METFHTKFLHGAGFNNADEYCEYMAVHPDEMDGLAVMITVMLNHVHICIHHKGGQWHTHMRTCPCACSLHLASSLHSSHYSRNHERKYLHSQQLHRPPLQHSPYSLLNLHSQQLLQHRPSLQLSLHSQQYLSKSLHGMKEKLVYRISCPG